MSRSNSLRELHSLLQQRSSADRPSPFSHSSREAEQRFHWPPGGLAAGEISEWIAQQTGSGEAELAISVLRPRLATESRWLIVDPAGEVYSPALERMGLSLSQIVFVRTREPAQAFWAVEQGLRSRGLDVVCCRLSNLAPLAFRRLKLAAEAGAARCLLLRDPEAVRETSWADLRLLVTPLPSTEWRRRRFRVETLKVRNGMPGVAVQVERDDETGVVRVVSELADSAGERCAAGA